MGEPPRLIPVVPRTTPRDPSEPWRTAPSAADLPAAEVSHGRPDDRLRHVPLPAARAAVRAAGAVAAPGADRLGRARGAGPPSPPRRERPDPGRRPPLARRARADRCARGTALRVDRARARPRARVREGAGVRVRE